MEEEDEDLQQGDNGADAYVDYDEEADDGAAGQELMEVDGMAIILDFKDSTDTKSSI